MNQLSFRKTGDVLDRLVAGDSQRMAATKTGVSHGCVFRGIIPRVGHGCSILIDLLFDSTNEWLDYDHIRHDGRKLKSEPNAYALSAIMFLHVRIVAPIDGVSVAMRLGIVERPWSSEMLAEKAIEAIQWGPPRWPSGGVSSAAKPQIYTLYGQTVTLQHLAELAGISKSSVVKRLNRGMSPEEAIMGPTRS